jgi:hypothetical protein
VGMVRTRRRRVREVGIFIGGRATFYRAEARRRRSDTFYQSQEGEGCDCGPLMRGVELRGGRASHRGSMAPVGERGRRTWFGRRIGEPVA